MKCGIITFHRAINYGGVLQAYALLKSLEKLGAEAEVIDYYSPYLERMYRPEFKDYFKKYNIKRIGSAILKNGIIKFNNRDFENFRNKYLKLSDKCLNEKELKALGYDKFITGSDQVWSYYCAGFDKSYFLDFVDEKTKKNSYAASFGVGEIPEELNETYKVLLSDFEYISVREQTGAEIVKKVTGKEAVVSPDPTLLLSKEEWKKIIPNNKENEKYLLVYMLAEDDELVNSAIEWGKKNNLKVYYISDRLYKRKNVINLRKVSPEKWLNLFLNAEYVFTNSFHGIAFSINFGRKLFVRQLKQNVKVNTRITNILNKFGISEYINSDTPLITDTEVIKKILVKERQDGLTTLEEILKR